MTRIVSWFSCGEPSAVATKIALDKMVYDHDVVVAYCDTGSEHPDNVRFMADVEKWLGFKTTILKSEKYADIWEVFEKTRWLVGVNGARCTTELKKKLRQDFEQSGDIQVFGYTIEEKERLQRFEKNNPEMNIWTPLIDMGLSRADCHEIVWQARIDTPEMYNLGYLNNNCIGCVKGQSGYWNKIRKDFPEVFNRMAKVERELNVAINKSYAGDGERKRVFLDELDPSAGRYKAEPSISCGLFCGQYLED
jgi:3'-phosphoadenosine 5'-phosphosulfate sulfotransferase (PAPS reductase)/FAD synthetase